MRDGIIRRLGGGGELAMLEPFLRVAQPSPNRREVARLGLAGLGLAGVGLAGLMPMLGLGACASHSGRSSKSAGRQGPLIIAHRGASAEYPEHSISAYQRAINVGADYIEPDLVVSKDGFLVIRHENEISQTTNIAEVSAFAHRKTRKMIDGDWVEGWFTEDFTLSELQSLHLRERLPALRPQNIRRPEPDRILSFDDFLRFVAAQSALKSRPIGIYPELKHPSYFAGLGFDVASLLLDALRARRFDQPGQRVFIQCFEPGCLKKLRGRTQLPLVQLIAAEGGPADGLVSGGFARFADMISPGGLAEIAHYAAAIGVEKTLVIPRDAQGVSLPATPLIKRAHDVGLSVHGWTFRPENVFLPRELRRESADGEIRDADHGDLVGEYRAFAGSGIDGLFCDDPAILVAAQAAH